MNQAGKPPAQTRFSSGRGDCVGINDTQSGGRGGAQDLRPTLLIKGGQRGGKFRRPGRKGGGEASIDRRRKLDSEPGSVGRGFRGLRDEPHRRRRRLRRGLQVAPGELDGERNGGKNRRRRDTGKNADQLSRPERAHREERNEDRKSHK